MSANTVVLNDSASCWDMIFPPWSEWHVCMLYVGSDILHEKSNQFNVLPIQTARKYNHPSMSPLLISSSFDSHHCYFRCASRLSQSASAHSASPQEALPSVSTIRVKHENAMNCRRVQQKWDFSHTYVEIPPVHGKLLIHFYLFWRIRRPTCDNQSVCFKHVRSCWTLSVRS